MRNGLTFVALIDSQRAFATDWCRVYCVVRDVEDDTNLKRDMRPGTTKAVFSHIDLYREYCE